MGLRGLSGLFSPFLFAFTFATLISRPDLHAPGAPFLLAAALLVAALVLGLVNAIVRPLMVMLTLPLTMLSFGLFLLVVNALAIGVVAALTPLTVSGVWGAVFGALVLSVISALLSRLFRDDRFLRRI